MYVKRIYSSFIQVLQFSCTNLRRKHDGQRGNIFSFMWEEYISSMFYLQINWIAQWPWLPSIKRELESVFCQRDVIILGYVSNTKHFPRYRTVQTRRTLRVVTTTGVPGSNFVIRDSEESSIVKKGRSIWDASAAEKLSRCRTQRVLPGILAGFELATERITQRTNAVQRIFLR